ncbi:hypothetical protein Tco_0173831 [Tanacetum coccineum]
MQTTHVVEKVATLPYDSPLLRVHSLKSDKGSMTLHELTVLCTTLSKKVESLESGLMQTKLTYGAAFIMLIMKVKRLEKEVKLNKARRRAKIVDAGVSLVQIDAEDQGRFKDDTDTKVSAHGEAYMSTYIKNQEGGNSIKQLKSLSFVQVKEIFEATMRRVQSFMPMNSELEVQKLKRAGQEVFEETAKKQKIKEALGSGEEQSAEKEKELLEEEL